MFEFKLAENKKQEHDFYNGVFRSFKNMKTSWIYRNYGINHLDRTMFPVDPNFIKLPYVLYDKTALVCGCGYNLNNRAIMQCEKMGFFLKKEQKSECCEIYIFYVIALPNRNPVRVGIQTKIAHNNVLKQNNLSSIVATCIKESLALYQYFGWEVIDVKYDRRTKRDLYLISYGYQEIDNSRFKRRQIEPKFRN